MQSKFFTDDDITRDLSRYREVARELKQFRRSGASPDEPPVCDCVRTAASLKYNHLYSGFAHLLWLDELLSAQPDLFD